MKNKIEIKAWLPTDIFTVLTYYADKQPHKMFEQYYWIKNAYNHFTPEKFDNILRKMFIQGWITSYGNLYHILPMQKRQHILTDKGDLLYRELAIEKTGDYSYYKYHTRKKRKPSKYGKKKPS
jgi:hypothetical protein